MAARTNGQKLVGVLMDENPNLLIGLLAIMKLGHGFVPINPDLPAERADFIVSDCAIPLLLAERKYLAYAEQIAQRNPSVKQVVCIEEALAGHEEARGAAPQPAPAAEQPAVDPDRVCYVIYTSGSTGKPKGVPITHRNLLPLMLWSQEYFGFGPQSRVIQNLTYAFDFGVFELLTTICFGGTMYFFGKEKLERLAEYVAFMQQHQIDTIHTTPSFFREIVGLGQPLPQLKKIHLGGEKLTAKLADSIFGIVPPEATLYNGYGPTETTINSSIFSLDQAGLAAWRDQNSLPIGRASANNRQYVLNSRFQPAPVGVPGELCIAGGGLAFGYLGRPDLTARAFVPDPLSDQPGARMYRTGDLVRLLPSGDIEYLGRIDHQVKVRGYRIELGEIEEALLQHPEVQEAVVVVRGEGTDLAQLAACCVPAAGARPSPSSLQAFLRGRLPAYMVPAAYMLLDSLPMTPNGKIDRRLLQERPLDPLEQRESAPPQGAAERRLAAIWAELLRAEQVGRDDDFFALGGHSLLATRLIAQIREAFGVQLPLRQLFETPTVAGLAAAVEQAGGAAGAALPPIAPVERGGELPLSFAQQRLWFLDRLEPGSAAYTIFATLRLAGSLDPAVFEQSINAVVARQEALRARFVTSAGRPAVLIAPALTLRVPVEDLGALAPEQRAEQVRHLAAEESQRTFDLAEGPLLRVRLLRLAADEHIVLLTVHHIVADGLSMQVLVQEVGRHYEALLTGAAPRLPELPVQYADFAAWQRSWLQGQALAEQLGYWKGQFADSIPVLKLPSDHPQPGQETQGSGKQTLALPPRLAAALRGLSQHERATMFMTLTAAWAALLLRHADQDEIVLGTPVANRTFAATEPLVGLFLNTLALRVRGAGAHSFRALLQHVREVVLEGYAHQHLPFEKLVEELQPPRALNRHPLFDVMINYLSAPALELDLPGLSLQVLDLTDFDAKYALTLYAEERGEDLGLRLVYRRDQFSDARAALLLEQLQGLLEQIAEAPDRPLKAYSLLTPQTAALLPDPRAALPAPDLEPITQVISAWAERAPQQPALRQDELTLSYAELVEAAATIARALLSEGVAKGATVAVYGPRSPGLIAGILGVLMGGGVVLPLAQDLPPQRQQVMLQEARAAGLVYVGARQPADAWLWEQPGLALVEVAPEARLRQPVLVPLGLTLPEVAPADPAYIFFTSGTTGVPKGVLGWHKGLAHFLKWQRETFQAGPGDRSAQLTGLSFDVVMRDIFLPLTSGATLCLPGAGDNLGPSRLIPWLQREQITLMHTVPSLARSWLGRGPGQPGLPDLRCVFFAGEPLTDTLVEQWRAAFPHPHQIVNLYGPTETTLAKCAYLVPAPPRPGIQPVGRPLPQTQALVLNAAGQLCGVGEPGEIVFRTPYRSLGYVNPRTEDSRRFQPNPFRDDPDDLVYYTGDQGQYGADGLLEIIGRVDNQVKIRGVRVELSEVEVALTHHPAVRAAVVVVQEETPGDKQLAAYVVAAHDTDLTPAALRTFLEGTLPRAVVPSAFKLLESLPLTPNGKVNRRALPKIERAAAPAAARQAPRNALEQTIAGVWQEVLGLERVDINDNFFDLGGHSLLLAEVQNKLHEALDREVPLVDLFQHASVSALAEHLASQQPASAPLQKGLDRAEMRRALQQQARRRR